MNQVGKTLFLIGVVVALLGLGLMLLQRLGLGRLPGDFVFRGQRVTVYLPLMTSIIASVLLTLLLNWWLRRR